MPEFELLESYYGERGYRLYNIYKDGVAYSLRTQENTYKDDIVYINNQEETIENIIFSIEIYYYKCLKENINLSTDEFISKFKLYEQNINEFYHKIANIYKQNQLLINTINNSLTILFNKSINDIVYETNFHNNLNLDINMLRINQILNSNISLEQILLDLYDHELTIIDCNIYNITINIEDDNIIFNTNKEIPYLTRYDIINDMYISDELMNDIRYIYTKKIYEYLNMKNDYTEESLLSLYKCLNIKYIKIQIDNNPKITWIMKKLYVKLNVYIPFEYVPPQLLDIINNNEKIDNCVYIKYNSDSSDIVQMNTFLIDMLHYNMHLALIYKI